MKDEFLSYIEEEKSKGFVEASRVDNILDNINAYTGRSYTFEDLPSGLYGVFVDMVEDNESGADLISSEKLDTYSVTYKDAKGKRDEYVTKLEPYIDYGIPLA